jgi:hypothetical protein
MVPFFYINTIMTATALSNTPTNQNFLHPNKFQLTFSRVPNIQYFCQAVSVPGISLSEIAVPTSFVEKYSPGEKAIYDSLNVTFAIDEEMRSWIEIHDWIKAMTFPENFEQYQQLPRLARNTGNPQQPQFSDATLTIYSSAYTPLYRMKFVDVFPTSLASFMLASQDTPENVLTSDATFRFTYYTIDKLF